MSDTPFGVYLHVPFCRHRCDYCAFATWTDKLPLAERYLAACRQQVEAAVAAGLRPVTSVFVGGGTPSLAPVEALTAVLQAIPTASGAEVTVECNPDDVTPELLGRYRAAGVTRISLGVQSTDPSVLAALGRTHTPANVRSAVDAVHTVGLDLNVDLIYGAAGESLQQWAATLDDAVALEPHHVSAYALTVEPGTPLARDTARHPDDDDQADKYQLTTDRLGAAGFSWYEISNWAKPGHECRHNLLYWSMGEYLAVGCAAHGHVDGRRFWHVRTPERYVAAIEEGRSPEAGSERLDPEARLVESWQLSLRTLTGVPAEAFDPADLTGPDGMLHDLVEVHGDRATLTVPGRLLANEVALRLVGFDR
jgi:oxygen-independent coproporphyrinogen-3 oxidase